MKTKILICCLVLMFMVFSGSVWAGNEGTYNTFYGTGAGANITYTGTDYDTFIGSYAGFKNTGQYNSFIGYQAGYNNTGADNTFMGYQVGAANTSGHDNNFIGVAAGYSNTTGNRNNFIGVAAGQSNTTGYDNSFIGYEAGRVSTGNDNTFVGNYAGKVNTTGYQNNFMGSAAGYSNTTGNNNNFSGYQAGYNTTTGNNNIIIGFQAGLSNTTESNNTLIGYYANIDGTTPGSVTNATAIGANAKVSQANSVVLGSIAGLNSATSSVNVGIGTSAPARQLHISGSNAVFRMDRTADTAAFMLVRTDNTIGASGIPWKTFVVGTNASGSGVGTFVINDLGTAVSGGGTNRMTINNDGSVTFTGNVYANSFVPSSMAYKDNIRTYENALETVNKLRGVRFDWKDSGKPSVGLIAEEVEKVIPEVVAHNEGSATGVNYASLVSVLVEAVKEQQVQHQAEVDSIKNQQMTIQEQQNTISTLNARVSELERLLKSK